jgi:hypothetical protein
LGRWWLGALIQEEPMSATDEERFTDFVRAHSGTLFRAA